jgi:Ser/Thr protein kinase RdoA (MazF antagonist)
MNTLYPLGDPEKILDAATADLFTPEGYALLLEMRAAAQRELDWLYDGTRAPQLVHGDLHWWNVMSYRGTLQVIDFEDLCRAFPVQDIAITLYYTAGRANYEDLRAAFRSGYEAVLPWPEMYPGQIEILMVHRAVDLFNFVLGSTYREDRALLDSFVETINVHHTKIFERWRSLFDEAVYR